MFYKPELVAILNGLRDLKSQLNIQPNCISNIIVKREPIFWSALLFYYFFRKQRFFPSYYIFAVEHVNQLFKLNSSPNAAVIPQLWKFY